MPHIVEDRILESTTTTGTGALTLAAALTGFRRFSAVCAVADTVPYFIEAIDSLGLPTGDYEYGVGTYSGANTLTRTKVLGSSNAGAAVNFSAGSKNVGMAALGGALVPTGASFDMTGSTVPSGYVKANGALLSRVAYPALWAYAQASGNISASDGTWLTGGYSPGDGATTFRVPDARGEFVRGWDDARGVDAGRAIGSAQLDAFQGHGVEYQNAAIGTALGATFNSMVVGNYFTNESVNGSTRLGSSTLVSNGAGVPRTAAETRPRSIAWLKIIKT